MAFQKRNDPYIALNIGYKKRLEEWVNKWITPLPIEYTIDDDLNTIIHDDLDLSFNLISWLPDNLTVKGYLDIRDTKITKLPQNLYVINSIFIDDNVEIPHKIKFGGLLYQNGKMTDKY